MDSKTLFAPDRRSLPVNVNIKRSYTLPMKRKLVILLLFGIIGCGLVAWLLYSPTPTIRFIEFRENQKISVGNGPTRVGRVAVFRITNNSRNSYSFLGYGPSWPFYTYRYPDPSDESGWTEMSPRKWGCVAETIAPHSTIDVSVHLHAADVQRPIDIDPSDVAEFIARADLAAQVPIELQPPFAIGIHFERCTAAELMSGNIPKNWFSEFLSWLNSRIDRNYQGPEPTWSTLAYAQ